jgi:hypothetical protein
MAKQFPQFDGKMHINQEFGNISDGSPDETLSGDHEQVRAEHLAPGLRQMGFMDAKFATQALLNIKGDVTASSYNQAVRALKNVKTSMLCKPWYGRREPRVPHPEQHRHHRHLQGWRDRDRGQVHPHPGGRSGAHADAAWEKKFNLNRQVSR